MPLSINIRFRLLAIIILGLILLGAGAVKLRRWQSQRNIENSLVEGLAAFDRQDWPKAAQLLGRYVGRNIERCSDPEVATICRQFAEAHLSIQPPQAATISTAISTYRRLLRDGAFDIAICERLAFLYQATGDLIELQYTADRLAEYEPTNPLVAFWRAQAAIGKNDSETAISELGALIQQLEGDPNRTPEYVRACVMMASIDSVKQSGRARTWLDRAITRDPKSPDPRLARARLLRNLARFQPTAARAELFEAIQQDLTVAMQFPSASAMTRLGLSEELRLRGQFDLAESQIRLARELPLEQVKDYYLDVADWRVDCGIQSIRIKTSQGKTAEAATEAQELLGGLSAPHNRLEILPMAVELLATTDRVSAARELLNEYKEMVPVVDLQTDARCPPRGIRPAGRGPAISCY
ncbi:MAG: hypothetical protein IPK83_03405 [Planctomycetes bacterium]|nr:hypothetical protein [Planctomycetota bacterium]